MDSFILRMAGVWEEYSQNTALIDHETGDWSYKDLQNCINGIKHHLLQIGLLAGARVGVFAPKSKEVVACFLACLELNIAYVPIDVHSPIKRVRKIVADGQLNALITLSSSKAEFDHSKDIQLGRQLSIISLASPKHDYDGIAYILFTSGSSGNPKGVVISIENAMVFVDWTIEKFDITENDILSSIAPFHFDLSVFDLYAALFRGASIVLFDGNDIKNPRLLVEKIVEKNVSVVYTTPTILTLMNGFGKLSRHDVSKIRLILFAGEVFPMGQLKKLREILKCPLYNLYGPTETNVVTWYQVPDRILDEQITPPPIGRMCPFAQGSLWADGQLKPLNSGISGELWISGMSVCTGYLNNEIQNAEKFEVIEGITWYKTGDLVEVNEETDLIYKGRIDRMVKRNGYRIELGEIEVALSSHEGIQTCAVIFLSGRIKAFIVPCELGQEYSVLELNSHCLKLIPAYMLPDNFVFLKSMPMTSSHKVNYQALKEY